MSSLMYARHAADPTDAQSSSVAKGGVFTAATFRYSEAHGLQSARKPSESYESSAYSQYASPSRATYEHNQTADQAAAMAAYAAAPSPQGMYVRALYDYDADDRTSLSFRQGDVIQVITQLESGWWDGIINNVRGWFPSNYCQLIPSPDDYAHDDRGYSIGMESDASGPESDWESPEVEQHQTAANGERRPTATSTFGDTVDQGEEAAFWIPQATADGRLYYYNILTGVATTELPLEAPTSANETGPADCANIDPPSQTVAPKRLHTPYEDDEASASEIDESFRKHPRRPRSYISEGASPTASMDDLNSGGFIQRNHSSDFHRPERSTSMAANAYMAAGYIAELPAPAPVAAFSQQASYADDTAGPPITWSRLVENMERAVAAYRDAVNNAERSEYVRRAEDISDHLRMLLAAGSGTTDNHSGNPSIISTNKALYPHFRDMMSKFSKLVLSSHIAAADWPAPDSYSKCLQEASGVLHGVYGYVEVARQQRGDDLPRLRPGFVLGATGGGSWRTLDDNAQRDNPLTSSFMDPDDDLQDTVKLDTQALDQLDEQRAAVTLNLTRLNASLIVREKIISPSLHEQVSSSLCIAARSVVESFKTYIAGIEDLDIKGIRAQETQVATFMTQKQVLYDLIANLVVSCQSVAGPLGDEWADVRGEPFEKRLESVKSVSKQLEKSLEQISSTLHGILELVASDSPNRAGRFRSGSRTLPHFSYDDSDEDDERHNRRTLGPNRNLEKLEQLLGKEVTGVMPKEAPVDDTPYYLRLNYEGEIAYDTKNDPPTIRGGTLTALVEQLTRHDRMDPSFNHTFLLTYRSFTTAQELFELLVKRFSIQPPQGLTNSENQAWVEKKQKLVRFRVVNVLKTWIETYWLESTDEQSNELLRRILSFATIHVASTNTGGASNLKTSIETRIRGGDSINTKRMVRNFNVPVPQPIVPKNLKKLKFLDIDPMEMARQLTILEFALYGKIKPYECLNKTWSKKVQPGAAEPAPNVKALITQSNQLANWVAEMILNQADVRKRVVVIKHFVNVAEKCRQLNNFSTLTAIITALNTASIHRLNRTWGQVNQKTLNSIETFRKLMASTKNYTEYRDVLHNMNPPCIPFFGVYLTDLTFIEDGIPSVIKKTNLINFSKRARTAEIIRDIQTYQNSPYPLQPVPELQTYISDSMKAANDVHEMYDRSLHLEPREREDEKIARLLSESGFL